MRPRHTPGRHVQLCCTTCSVCPHCNRSIRPAFTKCVSRPRIAKLVEPSNIQDCLELCSCLRVSESDSETLERPFSFIKIEARLLLHHVHSLPALDVDSAWISRPLL